MRLGRVVFGGLGICVCISASSGAVAWADYVCPAPQVMVYDFDNRSLRPSETDLAKMTPDQLKQAYEYMDSSFAAGGFFDEAFNVDPKHDQVNLTDVHFARSVDMVATDPVLPGAGDAALPNIEYDVTGVVQKNGPSSFVLSVDLADFKTGESVGKASVAYASAGDSDKAGRQAEDKLAALLDTIRKFQDKKRQETGSQTAISAHFEVTAEKSHIKIGEDSKITIKMVDCDGALLKHRKFSVRVKNGIGTISPSQLETDDSGLAHATFTGNKQGMATILAEFEYETVTHHHAQAMGGLTYVWVKDSPSGIWQMDVDVLQLNHITYRHQEKYSLDTNFGTYTIQGRFTAFFHSDPQADYDSDFEFTHPFLVHAQGTANITTMQRYVRPHPSPGDVLYSWYNGSGKLEEASFKYEGHDDIDPASDFTFRVTDNKTEFSVSLYYPMQMNGGDNVFGSKETSIPLFMVSLPTMTGPNEIPGSRKGLKEFHYSGQATMTGTGDGVNDIKQVIDQTVHVHLKELKLSQDPPRP